MLWFYHLVSKFRTWCCVYPNIQLIFCATLADVAELESQQSAAVSDDDFEKAASLAVKIEAQASRLKTYQQDISEVEKTMRSCSVEKTKVLEKAMQMFSTVVADVR